VKRLPRWAWILLIVVVVVVTIGLVVPYFLNLDNYRGMIASAIEKETGRKATIGKIQARLLPSVGFVVEGVGIGNPPGFPEGNLLSAERIRGSLAWGPLFRREFQLSSIEIVGPKLTLLEDDRGRVNYELEAAKPEGKTEEQSAFRLADIDSIELTGAEVTMARVTGRNRRIVPSLRARNLNVELQDVALDAKKLKQWKADADLDGVQLELSGLTKPVEFRSGDLALREGAIESKFDMALGDVTRARGQLNVGDIEKAKATFSLSTSLIDLDKLAEVTGESESAPPSRASRSGRRELVAQGRLAADRIRSAPYELTNASAEVRVFTDGLEIWPVTAQAYGGTIQVTARVDSRRTPQRFSSNIQVRNFDVGQAMAASPSTRGKMTGTAEADLQLFGSLGDSLMDSLTGSGRFAVVDGKFPGFNMGGTLQSMAKLQQILTLGAGSGGISGDTTFSRIDGDLKIARGRVASDRIHLESTSGTVDLRGSFGFDQTLNYDGQAVLMKSETGQASNPAQAVVGLLGTVMKQSVGRISVPFAVRGTFDDPKIQPGRGIPTISTSSQTTEEPTADEEKKKKSLFDLFRKP